MSVSLFSLSSVSLGGLTHTHTTDPMYVYSMDLPDLPVSDVTPLGDRLHFVVNRLLWWTRVNRLFMGVNMRL